MDRDREAIQSREEKHQAYAQWIASVRRKCGMTQEEFGRKMCHFEVQKTGEVCLYYHRNTIGNWENAKTFPINIETVVALALMDYSGHCEYIEADNQERAQRYRYVQKCMKRYLGKTLYCRNLKETLLIEAARGIYSLSELPNVQKKMYEVIQKVTLRSEEKREYAEEKKTDSLENALLRVENVEQFEQLVEREKYYFSLGARTVGVRMQNRYEETRKESGLSLNQAVSIYAPKCAESYNRIFFSHFSATRKWVLDFCVYMRFTKEEINEVLKNATMLPLSDMTGSCEYALCSTESGRTGTVRWYEEQAVKYGELLEIRYPEAKALSLCQKLVLCTLAAYSLKENTEILKSLPVDYLLEYFIQSGEGKKILNDTEKNLKKKIRELEDNPCEILEAYVQRFEDFFVEVGEMRRKTEHERKALQEYRGEFSRYLSLPAAKYSEPKEKEQAECLRFLAAVTYSVFTGKLYRGVLYKRDMEMLKTELMRAEENGVYMQQSYRFFSLLWLMFLGGKQIHRDSGKGFYLMQTEEKKSKYLTMEEVSEDIAATLAEAEQQR